LIATCSIGAMQLVLMLVLVVCQDDSFASSCCLYVLLCHFLELLFIDCYEQVNLITVHQVGVDTTQFLTYKLLLARLMYVWAPFIMLSTPNTKFMPWFYWLYSSNREECEGESFDWHVRFLLLEQFQWISIRSL